MYKVLNTSQYCYFLSIIAFTIYFLHLYIYLFIYIYILHLFTIYNIFIYYF